jgi:lactoylglutathione lyase
MRRVDYVIWYVESLERSVIFYRDVIGLAVRIEGDGYVEFDLDITKFSLFERSKLPELIGREGGMTPCDATGNPPYSIPPYSCPLSGGCRG